MRHNGEVMRTNKCWRHTNQSSVDDR